MAYRKMLVTEWINVEDNPIQRDTERHAAKAKHLLTPHPTHVFVFAAELPSGKLIKLDGHTRALMWKQKRVPAPMQVSVGVISVKDRAEAEQLYKDFDSREALETMRDKVSGGFNRYGFEPESPLLQYGSLTFALRMAYSVLHGQAVSRGNEGISKREGDPNRTPSKASKVDVYDMLKEFMPELMALDGLGIAQGQLSSGTIAAFLLSFRKYGHRVTQFWVAVIGNSGAKAHGQMDAVQALNELIMTRKGHYGGMAATDLCARALGAIEKWLKEEMLVRIPSPIDTTEYLVGYEQPTERLLKKKDLDRQRA